MTRNLCGRRGVTRFGAARFGELGASLVVLLALVTACALDGTSVAAASTPESDVASIVSGADSYCAILSSATVKCWGDNTYDQLGDGTNAVTPESPVFVKGLSGVASIVSGADSYCAILSSATVKCWGDNTYDQLGDGTNAVTPESPVFVKGLSGVASIVSGADSYCAILSSATVKCWGDNTYDQLGDGTNAVTPESPVFVKGLSGVASIVSGADSYCAILKSSLVKCWGDNTYDQLGDGTNAVTPESPVFVKGLSDVASIVSGADSYCAILKSSLVKCWGDNTYDQLGDGTNAVTPESPVMVKGLSGVSRVLSDSDSYCAILKSSLVKCWGDNTYDQLGDGTNAVTPESPVAVAGLHDVRSFTGGTNSYCAILKSSLVKCWGDNTYDQLGDGTNAVTPESPVVVNGLSNVVSIASATNWLSGTNGYCALRATGDVKCWGDNTYDQLGDGTNAVTPESPVTPRGLSPVRSLLAGTNGYCARLSAGSVKCWGDNTYDQLGDSSNAVTPESPVSVKDLP